LVEWLDAIPNNQTFATGYLTDKFNSLNIPIEFQRALLACLLKLDIIQPVEVNNK